MRAALVISLALVGAPVSAQDRFISNDAKAVVATALSEVSKVEHIDCTSDSAKYTLAVLPILIKQAESARNYYTSPLQILFLKRGWELASLNSADHLLSKECYSDAETTYRAVIKSSSDVSLQNRAMLGLEDVRAARRR